MKMFPIIVISLCLRFHTIAQHGHLVEAQKAKEPLSFASVLNTRMSDPELKEFKMESMLLTIVPGGEDTVAHRHDAEIFGYITEGKVEIGLNGESPKSYSAGQMFYEKRNILHSLTRNADKSATAKVLLIFIIKEGREGYTPEYNPPVKK